MQLGLAIDDVDEVEHHAALATHDEVEVAQADVEIDNNRFVATHGQTGGNCSRRGGFTNAALTGCDNDNFSQFTLSSSL